MGEYIGSRISLISKRDIRYVGTLHEISSENSTVALEQVKSYGTEGRSEEEVPPSDNIYEYIVFRGSDVKDLRIEKEPEKKPAPPPQIPDDPAILGNARPQGQPAGPQDQPPAFSDDKQAQPPGFPPGQGHRYPPHPPFPYGGGPPPPNQRFGPYGGPQGFPPHMPYGAPPPGWYGPPGQGFGGSPGQMPPPHMQQQFPRQSTPQHAPGLKPAGPADDGAPREGGDGGGNIPATVKLPTSSAPNAPDAQAGPRPPTGSKPDVAAALAPPAPTGRQAQPRNDKIQPAVPMVGPGPKAKTTSNGVPQSYAAATSNEKSAELPGTKLKSFEDANRDARAAVAAAMAKLPPQAGQPAKKQNDSGMDNLTQKVNEMRTNDIDRGNRGTYSGGARGGRGGPRTGRGGRTTSQGKKIEIPKTDYDFETANAKFNKQDLVKEAIASGDTVSSPVNGDPEELPQDSRRSSEQRASNGPGYSKTSSFFDDISSEAKDREDGSAKKAGGREFRSEEQKKNLETFGQGSVDNYRGGYRGRGRGRGFRGGFGRGGRGYPRGRGGALSTEP